MFHEKVAKALGGTLVKLSGYGVSWALTSPDRGNNITKWVELVGRKQESHRYPTFSMPLSKVLGALHLEEHTAIPAILVVRFADSIVTTYFNRFLVSPKFINAQQQLENFEPMWHIPVERMHRILDIDLPETGTTESGGSNEDDEI